MGLEWMMCFEGIQAGVERGPTYCTQVDCLIVKISLKADGLNIDFYKLCFWKICQLPFRSISISSLCITEVPQVQDMFL